MNIADVFDWFVQESMEAGNRATEWEQREMFLKLALLWAATAQQCRKEASTPSATSASSWGPGTGAGGITAETAQDFASRRARR